MLDSDNHETPVYCCSRSVSRVKQQPFSVIFKQGFIHRARSPTPATVISLPVCAPKLSNPFLSNPFLRPWESNARIDSFHGGGAFFLVLLMVLYSSLLAATSSNVNNIIHSNRTPLRIVTSTGDLTPQGLCLDLQVVASHLCSVEDDV